MPDNEKDKIVKRRDFLVSGLLLGATTGVSALDPFKPLLKEEVVETGEIVKLLSVDGEIIEIDKAYLKPVPDIPKEYIKEDDSRKGIPGKKFVMVIDLSRCKNLKKCQLACSHMHHLTGENSYLKVYKMQNSEHTSPYWQPTLCLHCDEPPCVKVCPVGATYKRNDGIVDIDNERCIGCRFCMAACPYSARIFNWGEPKIPQENLHKEHSSMTSLPQRGTVGKCDFCPSMVKEGKLPHCVGACPNGVFYFGDFYEDAVTNGSETVRFNELIKDRAGYRLMEDLGTKPRVYYLPPTNRLFPFEEGLENKSDHDEH
jgi:Fe-S-cluster-containing dehydrogenase component